MSIAQLRSEVDLLKDLLDEHDEILIFGHKDADGDTLGCSLAFAEALRGLGKQVYVVIPPPLPDKYDWMPGFSEIVQGPPAGADPRLVLFFDAGNMERSGSAVGQITAQAVVVNVDHHSSNSRFGQINIIDPDAAAVGQICLDMLEHYGWEVTPTMATNLYTALMTDTGGFRHENTDARALEDGARLAYLGADPSRIATMVYKSRPLSTIRLSGLSVASMKVEMSGRLAWARVTRAMLQDAGAVMAESEGIIDTVNSIQGLEVAILLKEVNPALTKVSVRTRGRVDAADLCGLFGGGGHLRAAGAEIHRPIDEAAAELLEAARAAIAEATSG